MQRQFMESQIKIYTNPPPEYGTKAFECQISSDLELKNPLIDKIIETLNAKGLVDEEENVWARLCIDEVLVNAIRHGNKEDKNKKVSVSLFVGKNVWALRVEDEGDGFSEKSLPTTEGDEYWDAEHGRGILLMQSYLDEIWYYNKGSRVQLKKIKRNKWQKILKKFLSFFKFNK
jgi:serine/threonine-protein kinase RsbW